ncbi:MAG: M56 family metallopeptidase [Limisphaerales bacterium]
MNTIISFLNQTGDAALHFAGAMAWQAALVIAVVFGLDTVLRNRSGAALRYALWLLVLVKLLLPPSLALPTGIGYWIRASQPPAPPALAPEPTIQVSSEPMEFPLPSVVEPLAAPAPTLHDAGMLLALWTGGVVVLLVLLVVRSWRLMRVVAGARLAPDSIQALVQAASGQVKLTKPVSVRTSDSIGSPAVCGLWKPIILLPTDLTARLSGDHLRSVLLHELLHVKRKDVWANCLQTLLQAAYWWHPLVWFANEHIRRTREEVVDEGVMVALGKSSEVYPSTLLEVAKGALRRPLTALGLVGIFESRSALRQRIQRLIDRPVPRSARLNAVGWGAVLTTGILMLPMAQGKPAEADSAVGVASGNRQMATNESVFLDCRIIEIREEGMQRLQLGAPHVRGAESGLVWVFDATRLPGLVQRLESQSDARFIAHPKSLVAEGRTGMFSVQQAHNFGGDTLALGPVCNVTPWIDGTNVNLQVKATVGMVDPGDPPRYTEQQLADLSVTIPDRGGALVMDPKAHGFLGQPVAILLQPVLGWQPDGAFFGAARPLRSGQFVREPGMYSLDEKGSRLEIGSDTDGGLTLRGIWQSPNQESLNSPSSAMLPWLWFVYIESPDRLWVFYGGGKGALFSHSEVGGLVLGFETGVLADAPKAFVDALPEQVRADYNPQAAAGSRPRVEVKANQTTYNPGAGTVSAKGNAVVSINDGDLVIKAEEMDLNVHRGTSGKQDPDDRSIPGSEQIKLTPDVPPALGSTDSANGRMLDLASEQGQMQRILDWVVEAPFPSIPLRPDPYETFSQEIHLLSDSYDRSRLRSLYWSGSSDADIDASLDLLEPVLAGSHDAGLWVGIKELGRLPEESRAIWTRRMAKLTSSRASAVCLMTVDGLVVDTLPLRVTDDGLRIIPKDRISHHE